MRVRTETLDRFLGAVGEVILSSHQLRTAVGLLEPEPAVVEAFDRVERRVAELQRRALELRTAPLLRVLEALPRTARQIATRAGKRVEVELVGVELELDRSILDRLSEPLLHLLRNAVDHGIEPPDERRAAGKPECGRVVIAAQRRKDAIAIELRDDGRGIDVDSVRARAVASGLVHPDLADDLPAEEIAALVFRPGISTAEGVSEVSGRGVGMDAVRATIEALGGSVELRSERGAGTATLLSVPLAAAVQRVLLVAVGGERVAIPIARVEKLIEVPASAIEASGGDAFVLLDDEPVLVLDLAQRAALAPASRGDEARLAVVEMRGERVALRVDHFAGQQEIYVKPLPDLMDGVRALAGLTLLDDGTPVFLLDLNHLV